MLGVLRSIVACLMLLVVSDVYADEVCNRVDPCYERDGIKKYPYYWLKNLISGEDTVNNVLRTETRYVNIPVGGTTSRISSDQLYKTGSGYVKSISCFSDAVATAGNITIYDNTVGGSGNVLWSFDVQAISYAVPFVVPLEVEFSVGLFLDFTTTNDMFCTVSYR